MLDVLVVWYVLATEPCTRATLDCVCVACTGRADCIFLLTGVACVFWTTGELAGAGERLAAMGIATTTGLTGALALTGAVGALGGVNDEAEGGNANSVGAGVVAAFWATIGLGRGCATLGCSSGLMAAGLGRTGSTSTRGKRGSVGASCGGSVTGCGARIGCAFGVAGARGGNGRVATGKGSVASICWLYCGWLRGCETTLSVRVTKRMSRLH